MNVRPMLPYEENDVRHLYARCHAQMEDKPEFFFFVNPTLVAVDEWNVVLGMTAFSVDTQADGRILMIGLGVSVAPWAQGQGVGAALCAKRAEVARAVGVTHQVVSTEADNAAMIAIFERQGLVPLEGHGQAYPDGTPMLVYHGAL